jgi:NAD-specific glutamate dehydrogenase
MKIDPRGSRAGRAQDPGPSIDAVEDEEAIRRLLTDANAILRSRVASVPSDFVTQVFAGAVPEDLVHYQACEIADIAEGTWRFIGERQPQTPKIRVGTPHATSGQRLNDVSIVEILNDDMPFLVDSVMAELTEHGLTLISSCIPDLSSNATRAVPLLRSRLPRPPAHRGDGRA